MAPKKSPGVKPKPKLQPKSKPNPKPAQSEGSSDRALVRDLAEILRATELTEIEVERNGLRVRVARQQMVAQHLVAPNYQSVTAGSATLAPLPASTSVLERAQNPGAVKSPMVGTAYTAPSPGAAPFMKIGDRVEEGQTLVIIEAMKTMNQIPAPRAGTVKEIMVKDGQPVEYGEVLMIIE